MTTQKVPNDERKRRLAALRNAELTLAEKNEISTIIEKGPQTIWQYLSGEGSNYWTEMEIIEAGEAVIAKRSAL